MQKTTPSPLRHLIALCLAASMLSSCSRIKLAYRFGDFYLSSRAHRYLRLEPDQEELLKTDIKAYMAWHRATMLPAYAQACRKLERGLRGQEPAEASIAQVTPLIGQLYADTLLPLAKPVAVLLTGLSPGQIAFLTKALKSEQDEQRKKFLADAQGAQRRRLKQTLGYIEDFSGPLTGTQQQKIRELTLALHLPTAAWLNDHERRCRQLLQLLHEKKSEATIEAALNDWWQRARRPPATPDPTRMDPAQLRVYFLGVFQELTPQQKELAASRLEDYARDFDELAAAKDGE